MNAITLFAQGGLPALTFIQWVLIAMVVAGVIGIALVVARQCGVTIPQWFITICWIVLAVVVGVIAVRFLASLIGF